jgi:hypothetical protein
MELHFHPFRIQMVQELLPHYLNMQRGFCTKLLEMMDTLPQFFPNLATSDEAYSHLSGFVNKQDFRYWAEENPHFLLQSPLRGHQVTVWCGHTSLSILGPYFFKTTMDMQLR